MELYAQDMFFRGDNEKQRARDCCIHGKVVFKIGENLLSDGSERCVSASAYRFLHTISEDHFTGSEDFLIPCCGHTMIAAKDGTTVNIIGCDNGTDFDIIHGGEYISVVTSDNIEYQVPFEEYKNAVVSFAGQITDFYKSNPPREPEDGFERDGYGAFIAEFYSLYNRAVGVDGNPKTGNIGFEDYEIYSENEIMGISREGISLNSFRFINFKECAYNFRQVEGGSGKCVGEREITDLSFAFYTFPKPTVIKFIAKNRFFEAFSRKNAVSRFEKLQKRISEYGYGTRDRS